MIELERVSFRYAETDTDALRNLSLKVEKGKCVVLSGSSGCGKTTVTRLINGLIPSFYPGEFSGTVKVDGEEIAGREPHELATKIGSVFQNPRTQFFNTDTDSEIVFGMENCGVPYEEMHRRYDRTVRELHLERLCGRDIFALSGGEKQQIAFGSIYALSPEIYVLDEPSANLDEVAISRLRAILLHLKKLGKTLLISEHRLCYLREVADQVAWMEDGSLAGLYEMRELAAAPTETLYGMGLRTLREVDISVSPASCPAKIPALEIRKLSVKRGKKTVLENVGLMADDGDIVGITGENGIGKTTLARTVCGLMSEEEGCIYFHGERTEVRARKQGAFLVMQDPNYQLFSDSVAGETALTASGEIPPEAEVQRVLSSLELTTVRDRHPLSLSGGQKQRLCIALAALSPARILFFDEPTSGLDFKNMCRVAEMFRELAKKKTILVISHDREFLNLACTRIMSLSK